MEFWQNLKTFAVYRSFNTESIFKPTITNDIKKKTKLYFNKNFKKIKNKEDVVNISVENIPMGELLYDSYIRLKKEPTIDIFSEDFKDYYINFVELTFFWIRFLKKNNVKGIVVSHPVYVYSLPTRVAVAISKKISCYIATPYSVVKVNRNTIDGGLMGCVKNYKKDFDKLPNEIKIEGIIKAKNMLNARLLHSSVSNHEFGDRSSFGPILKKKFIKNKNKFNVLISTHDFFDAPHFHGKFLFPDW